MKKLLLIALLFTSCTKQFELPIQNEIMLVEKNETFFGYKAILVLKHDNGNYIIHTQIGTNLFKVYPNVINSNVTIVNSTKSSAFFYTSEINPNKHLLEIPIGFTIGKFNH